MHLERIKKGGRKIKVKRTGKPKSMSMTIADIMQLSPTKLIPQSVKNAVGHVVN